MKPEDTRGTITQRVEISHALHDLIHKEKEDGQTLNEYIAEAASKWMGLQLALNHEYDAVLDVPEEAALIGRLRAEDVAATQDQEVSVEDFVMEHVSFTVSLPREDGHDGEGE